MDDELVQNMTMEDWIEETLAFATRHHSHDHSGHGSDHVVRVWQTARMLAEKARLRGEEADLTVLELAALLHDADDHKINPGGHSAEDHLRSMGLDPQTAERVLDTIRPISFSVSGAHPQFCTLEQKLLSDADKLDAMGAIGVARAVAYGAAHGRALYGSGETTIGHFHQKLLLLREAMQTPEGLHEAETRHRFLEDFLNELEREVQYSNK